MFFCLGAAARAQMPALPKDAEQLRRYAIDRYHEQDYANSERGFYQYIVTDRQGAPEAIDYLKNIMRKSGKLESTKQSFLAQKTAGKLEPKYLVDPTAPGKLKSLENPTQFVDQLIAVFKKGGIPSAEGILLSQILSVEGNTDIAEYLIAQTEDRVRDHQTEEEKRQNVEQVRPLTYRFPTLAESDRLLPYSHHLWRIVRFAKYDDSVIRQNSFRLRPAFAFQFNSNVPEKAKQEAPRFPASKQQGVAQKLAADLGFSTSPIAATQVSVDYHVLADRYPRSDFVSVNEVTHWGSLSVSWWNSQTTEIRARYDVEANIEPDAFNRFPKKSHGPSLMWAQRFGDRYQVSLGAGVRQAIDLYQKGKHSTFELEGADLYGKKALHPFLRLSLLNKETALDALHEISIRLAMGSQVDFSENSFLILSPGYRFSNLPSGSTHIQRRITDVLLRYGYRFGGGPFGAFAEALYRTQKSTLAIEEFQKFRAMLGVSFAGLF